MKIMTKTTENNSILDLFNLTKSRELVKKIVFTGMMLGLVFVLSYLETFATLGWGFLQVNFSLIFVLGTLFYSGKEQTLLLMLCKLFLTPLLIPRNSYVIDLTNNFILFFQEALFITFIVILSKIKRLNTISIIVLSLLCASVVIPWIRGAFLQPLFYYAWGMTDGVSLSASIAFYHQDFAKPFYFYIENYWLGNFVIFFLSNMIRFSIAIFIIFPLIKIIAVNRNNGWGYEKVKKRGSKKENNQNK